MFAFVYNHFVYPIIAVFSMLANFIGNTCFNDATAAVKVLFLDMANACIGYVLNMARSIENIINKIPGVTVDITSGLEGLQTGLETKITAIKDESGWKEQTKPLTCFLVLIPVWMEQADQELISLHLPLPEALPL